MWFVEPSLIAEGTTDLRFVGGLVQRILDELLCERATGNFELADVIPIGRSAGLLEPPVVAQIVNEEGVSFTIVFIHRDADARDLSKAGPWMDDVVHAVGAPEAEKLTFLVPIRASEAWALCDGDALRAALGVTWSDSELGIPSRPARVEQESDPKAVVLGLVARASGPPVDLYARLAALIDLNKLLEVPSFLRVVSETAAVLTKQGVIR